MRNKIIRLALTTGLVMLLPLLAMQVTDDVAWSAFDFAVAGVLLFSAGLVYVLTTRHMTNRRRRIAVGVAVAAALLLIWIELAVGLFGTPFTGS
jgi:hypothetical protein